jgi:integrase
MGGVYRPTRPDQASPGKRISYKAYRIWYVDGSGRRRTEKAYSDKAASRELLRRREVDAERRRAGLLPTQGSSPQMSCKDAWEAYAADLARRGKSPHWQKSARQVPAAVCKGTGWLTLGDICPAGMTAWLAARATTHAAGTLNQYLRVCQCWLRFCVRQGWLAASPLDVVEGALVLAQPRRTRPLHPDELLDLIASTGTHKTLYAVAALSGLRRAELRRLERRDVDLSDPARPLWRLRAEAVKSRRAEVVPMLPECATLLRAHLATRDACGRTRVFETVPGPHVVQADIARATIDTSARSVGLHSLRKTFCCLLARVLPIQVVRLLMRHQSITITVKLYLELGLDDVAGQILQLPNLLPPGALPGQSPEDRA